jgi:hypothetical protein
MDDRYLIKDLCLEAEREIQVLSYVLGLENSDVAELEQQAEKEGRPLLVKLQIRFQMFNECFAYGGIMNEEFEQRKKEKEDQLAHLL